MKIIAKETKMEKVLVEEGTHQARVIQVIYMGTVENYFGEAKPTVRLTFEFPTQLHEFDKEKGEQPLWRSVDINLNFNEKSTLRKIASATKTVPDTVEGEVQFDATQLLNKTCLVSIEHRENKKGILNDRITGYMPLVAGMEVPEASQEPLLYSVEEHDSETFDKLPNFLQEKIKNSSEWQIKKNNESEVPF